MTPRQLRARIVRAIPVVALSTLLLAIACEPWDVVEYENQTSEHVFVYKGGELQFDLKPGQTRKFNVTEEVWLSDIRVVTDDGQALLEDNISWDELRRMDFRIVIRGAKQEAPSGTISKPPLKLPTG